jgi:hypothetical protein
MPQRRRGSTAARMLTSGYRRSRGSPGSSTASKRDEQAQAVTVGDHSKARRVRRSLRQHDLGQ